MTSAPPWANTLLLIAAILVAAGTVYRYVYPALKAFARGVRGAVRLYKGTQAFIHDWTGGDDPEHSIPTRIRSVEKELRPNGGGSLRDAVDKAANEARGAAGEARQAVEAAKVAAEGVVRLEQGQTDHAERLTDIHRQVDTQDQRITDHRRRQEETVERLEAYIRGERDEHIVAIQGLEASVTELLHMPESPPEPPAERGYGDD